MFPGDTQWLPICVPALPSVTAILHMLHLPLAICLAWTLTNKLLYFTFATESSFVIVTQTHSKNVFGVHSCIFKHKVLLCKRTMLITI